MKCRWAMPWVSWLSLWTPWWGGYQNLEVVVLLAQEGDMVHFGIHFDLKNLPEEAEDGHS